MTLQKFSVKPETIPTSTSWYLADLSEARGKQELFTRQTPQRLKVLREHALIESAVSSNRIEGVQVDQSRVRAIILGRAHLRDRNEEEVRGYRNALNLDFLCIHPFRDGNGRASRLLLLLQCYHLGYEVGRYISLERLIEQNKDRYYETLEQSSQRWHEGRHDPWPYINYVLFILKCAYREFEERVGQIQSPRGAKTELITSAVEQTRGPFRVSDIQRECPGVSLDMIRRVLKSLRATGQVKCLGRGQNAQWQRLMSVK